MKESRLFRLFQPKHYALYVNLEREERRFSGTVTIHGTSSVGAQTISLHAHRLDILSATIDEQVATVEPGAQDLLSLAVPGLQPGEHEIIISFEGKITNPMHGLYPCYFKLDDKDEELLATLFESHHAREVFPCVDEPEAKATFDLTLQTETGIEIVSNTPIKDQHEKDDTLLTKFETTPVMSTYLLAWVVGKLDYQEATTKDGVVVRAYATRGKGDQVSYALKAAVDSLEVYNDYFGVPYPLPKCDLVALPDFSAGAMENWGCITFRETVMLVDEHSSTDTKQQVVMVITHELAHQWFGNLVTMRWWNDLWLNESFANWMEYFVANELHPEWDVMTQYYDDETAHAIERDSLASVQKIQQDVHTVDEIQTLFDPAIVYAKGGSLLSMLHTYLGADVFRKGLQLYFERHKYGNTDARDLWKAWGEIAGRDIVSFMQPWITQAGLPVVTAGISGNTVNINQRRFFSNPREAIGNEQTIWPIPLLANSQLDRDLLAQPSASLQLKDKTQPLMLNQGRTGYYLTMYDEAHIEKLAAEVHNGHMSVMDRMGLLNDSLSLSDAGLQTQLASLKLLDSYRNETSLAVWGPITSAFGMLKMFADNEQELLVALRLFIRDHAVTQFRRLGWEPIHGESYFDELLRPLIIGHMAYAEDKAVITKLLALFTQADSPTDIWADIRAIVFAIAAKFGNVETFEKLLAWHGNTTSAEQRTQLVAGLCGFREPELIERALSKLTTDAVKLQDLGYWIIHLMQNRYALDATWQWIQDNWQWIVDHFGNDMHYTDFPKYVANAFSKPEQLESYKAFFEPKLGEPGIKRTIRQGIEDIEGRVLQRERDGRAVAEYLRSFTIK
jgi:aminopeptidase N